MATETPTTPETATPPAQSQAPSQAPSDIQPNLNHILALLLDQAIPIEDVLSELNLKAHQLAELVQTPRAIAATDSLMYLWNLRTDLLAAQARAEAMLTLIELSRPSRGNTPELTRRAAMAVIKHRPLCRGSGASPEPRDNDRGTGFQPVRDNPTPPTTPSPASPCRGTFTSPEPRSSQPSDTDPSGTGFQPVRNDTPPSNPATSTPPRAGLQGQQPLRKNPPSEPPTREFAIAQSPRFQYNSASRRGPPP